MLVHGVKGGVWDRSCRAHTVLDSIPSIASIIPKMRMMRGSGGTIPLGGYVAQGLVHIYIYIYTYIYIYIHTICVYVLIIYAICLTNGTSFDMYQNMCTYVFISCCIRVVTSSEHIYIYTRCMCMRGKGQAAFTTYHPAWSAIEGRTFGGRLSRNGSRCVERGTTCRLNKSAYYLPPAKILYLFKPRLVTIKAPCRVLFYP